MPAFDLRAFALVILLLLAPACTGEKPAEICQDKSGCVSLPPGEPITLGVIQSLSGKLASIGTDQVRGLELALARRGDRLLGREVRLIIEDTGCRPEGGANAALKIVSNPDALAIFGTTCSGDAASAAQVMTEAGLSMISGNNSAPFLTSIGGKRAPKWQPGYLRTANNEEHAGPAAARFVHGKLGVRRVATINDGDIYTKGLTDGFKQEFERLGGRVALYATVNKGDDDMAPVLEAVLASGAELVFFPLFQPEGNKVLLKARAMPGFEKLAFMSDGALIDQTFIDSVKEAAVGMYFVGPKPAPPGEALDRLASEYKARYGEEPRTEYYTSAFDAVNILFAAIEKTGRQARDGTLTFGRQALRDALYATRAFQGVGGSLSCDEFGDCGLRRFDVLRLEDPSLGIAGLKANVVYSHAP